MTSSAMVVARKYPMGARIEPGINRQVLHGLSTSKLAISNCKNPRGLWANKARVQECDNMKAKRHSSVVHAASGSGAPLPSGAPPPSSIKGWIIGILMSLILPFITSKWGQLSALKNRIETAVETVEQMAEVVEKVAEQVDKIAEDIGDDLPQGKLKELVDMVEDVAEKTAQSADTLGDLIDKVQEAEDEVESIVESIESEAKIPPNETSDRS